MGPSVQAHNPEQLSLLLSDPAPRGGASHGLNRNTEWSLKYQSLYLAVLVFLSFASSVINAQMDSPQVMSSMAIQITWFCIIGVTVIALWMLRYIGLSPVSLLIQEYLGFLLVSSLLFFPHQSALLVTIVQLGMTATLMFSCLNELMVHFFEKKTRGMFNASFPILKVLSDSLSRNPLTLNPGVWIRIAQGEHVPVDGSVISGEGVVRSHHMQGNGGGIRVCRAGDEIKAGEFIIEGALAVKVERPWPYHEYAQLSRFAEESFDYQTSSNAAVVGIADVTLAVAILSTFVGLWCAESSVSYAILAIVMALLFLEGLSSAVFTRMVDAALFGSLFRAGVLLKKRASYAVLRNIDGISVAAGNENFPVVRKESVFVDGVDSIQFAKIVFNLIGPALDDWAVALKEFLIKKIPDKSSILQGVKSLSRIAPNGFRAEYEGHEILIGDESALRGRGIILELSEVALSVKDSVVYFVAINGEVAARYEIEMFPSNELSQQLEVASHHGVYVDIKTQKNLDPHSTLPGCYKFFSRNRDYGYALWEMNLDSWAESELARCMSHYAFIAVPKVLVKVRVLSLLEKWSKAGVVLLSGTIPFFLYTSLQATSLSALGAAACMSGVVFISLRSLLVGLVSSEKL
jgi:hypothetical protein